MVENSEIDDEIRRLFTEQEFDKESGLYYYNQRYYAPQLGIFINPDPAKDGINHYVYCLNNPIIYNDPTGEFVDPVTLGIIIGAICGAYQGYQIGQANGASGWESVGYTLGGAIIGA